MLGIIKFIENQGYKIDEKHPGLKTRLNKGDKARNFITKDYKGNDIKLEDYRGKKIILAFCRYITCPLCKLFVARLTRNYRRLKEQGLEIIIVYESPAESIMKYYKDKEEPFRVIPDPDRELYNLYGVESSREGFIKGMTRFSDMIEIVKKGLASFKPEGDLATIPADFLINENFVVEEAYYGEDIGDNIPIDDIKTFAGIK